MNIHPQDPQKPKWFYEPWVVLLIIFLAAGPFGLPLLYKSPKFSRSAKIIFTILTLAFTFYLIYLTIHMVQLFMNYASPLMQSLQ